MKHTYLHDVLPFLRELEREKQKQFEAYFRTAPLWLMDLFQSEIMEAGTTFIRENEPADTIFFVARGRVKATDYRISGIAYDFMKPMNLIALGGMEVILGQDTYQTTLQTETGLCLKSISRAIKKFQADQLIVKKGNQICIDRKQYERLKRIVDEKIGNV